MKKLKPLVFPDPSELYHLLSRTAAADFRNGVRYDVIQLGGEFLRDEFNPHEFFPAGGETIILSHQPAEPRGGSNSVRVLAHAIAPNGDGIDLYFNLPPLEQMREILSREGSA